MGDTVFRRRDEFRRRLAVWVREENLDLRDQEAINRIMKPFEGKATEICTIPSDELNIHPLMMYFGEEVSTLGVIATESGKPRISFSLDHKPFSDDGWFHTQMLVASVSFIGVSTATNITC